MVDRKMHADEVETDESLVRRLLAAQFPNWSNLTIARVASFGTDNAIYTLGEDLAVRMPRIEWATAQVDKESRWLPVIAPLLPLTVPAPIATGAPAEGYPWSWSVVPWLPGQDASNGRIDDLNRAAIDLAQFLTALRRIDTTGGPAPSKQNFFRGVPLRSLDRHIRAQLEKLGRSIDNAVRDVWDAAVAAPVWDKAPVWVHGDLMPGNLIVTHGQLSAVIDFGCLGVADPACDLIPAWYLFSGESRRTFRQATAADDATWARARGWVVRAIGGLIYYANTNPAMVAQCQRGLAEVVDDFRRDSTA
jgi:aminoglycoside phosphotransferase (APT) family kinase protein